MSYRRQLESLEDLHIFPGDSKAGGTIRLAQAGRHGACLRLRPEANPVPLHPRDAHRSLGRLVDERDSAPASWRLGGAGPSVFLPDTVPDAAGLQTTCPVAVVWPRLHPELRICRNRRGRPTSDLGLGEMHLSGARWLTARPAAPLELKPQFCWLHGLRCSLC